ncbi:hypothetical protein KUTeg_024220, partial [Tegillarca granosa]
MNVGCFGPFEPIYEQYAHKFMRQNIGRSITRYDICALACKVYDHALCPENIRSAFRKNGIYPFSADVVDSSCTMASLVYKGQVEIERDNQENNDNSKEKSEQKVTDGASKKTGQLLDKTTECFNKRGGEVVKSFAVAKKAKKKLYSHNQLADAYNAVTANGVSVYTASRRFGIPEQTLRDRVKGFIDVDSVNSGRSPVLSLDEEAKLVNHLVEMAKLGYGYTRQELTNFASNYAVQLNKRSINNPLTLHWFHSFRTRSLEFARAKGASMTTVDSYFKEIDQILSKYNLKDSPHLIFNIDESGFMTNNKPPFVVTSSEINFKPQAVTSPRSQTVTVIGAGSASGIAVPPYFVFPGARIMPDLLKDGTPGADVCKAYAKSISSENLFSGFRKCGISPFNKDAIPLLSLAPSTVFNEIGKVKDDNDNKNNNESGGNNKCTSNENSPSLFMNEKLKEIIKNKGKEKGVKRKCLSNITSGKPVTEEDVFNEIQKYKKGQKNGTKKLKTLRTEPSKISKTGHEQSK